MGKFKVSEKHDDCAWVSIKKAFDYNLTEETRRALIVLEDKIKEAF